MSFNDEKRIKKLFTIFGTDKLTAREAWSCATRARRARSAAALNYCLREAETQMASPIYKALYEKLLTAALESQGKGMEAQQEAVRRETSAWARAAGVDWPSRMRRFGAYDIYKDGELMGDTDIASVAAVFDNAPPDAPPDVPTGGHTHNSGKPDMVRQALCGIALADTQGQVCKWIGYLYTRRRAAYDALITAWPEAAGLPIEPLCRPPAKLAPHGEVLYDDAAAIAAARCARSLGVTPLDWRAMLLAAPHYGGYTTVSNQSCRVVHRHDGVLRGVAYGTTAENASAIADALNRQARDIAVRRALNAACKVFDDFDDAPSNDNNALDNSDLV